MEALQQDLARAKEQARAERQMQEAEMAHMSRFCEVASSELQSTARLSRKSAGACIVS